MWGMGWTVVVEEGRSEGGGERSREVKEGAFLIKWDIYESGVA